MRDRCGVYKTILVYQNKQTNKKQYIEDCICTRCDEISKRNNGMIFQHKEELLQNAALTTRCQTSESCPPSFVRAFHCPSGA